MLTSAHSRADLLPDTSRRTSVLLLAADAAAKCCYWRCCITIYNDRFLRCWIFAAGNFGIQQSRA
jgi:hypothetical protein